MSNEILPGYQIHIESWEGDGDHSKTKVLSGLTEDDVKFIVDLAESFRSCNGYPKKGCGNSHVNDDAICDILSEVLSKHPNVSEMTRELFEDDEHCYDVIVEHILGYPVENRYGFCRVYEDYRVFFVETPIHDVTTKFK